MPRYEVEVDGRRFVLEGDRPPTEEEARQAVGVSQTAQPQRSTFGLEKAETIGAARTGLTSKDLFPVTTESSSKLKTPLGAGLPVIGILPVIQDLFRLPSMASKGFGQAAEASPTGSPIDVLTRTPSSIASTLRGGETREPTRERELFGELGGEALTQAALGGVGAVAASEALRGGIKFAKSRFTGEKGIFGKRGLLGGARKELEVAQKAERDLLAQQFQDIRIQRSAERKIAVDEARSRTAPRLQRLDKAEQAAINRLQRQQDELGDALLETADKQVIKVRENFKRVGSEKAELYRSKWDRAAEQSRNMKVPASEVQANLTESLSHRPEDIPRVMNDLFPSGGVEGRIPGDVRIGDVANRARLYRSQKSIGARSGQKQYTSGDDLADSISDGLAKVARDNGITGFDDASAVWADWAPLRNDLWRDYKPYLRSDSQIAKSTSRLIETAKSKVPGNERYIQQTEEVLGVPLLPEQRAIYARMTTAQQAEAAKRLELGILREKVKLTESRAIEDVDRFFGIKKAEDLRQLRQMKQFLEKNQSRILQDFTFKQRVAQIAIGTPIGITALGIGWNLINNFVLKPIFGSTSRVPG